MKIKFLIPLILIPISTASIDAQQLCIDNHPVKRRPDVTYGHLPPKHGFERDHFIPLCLGGEDAAAQNPNLPPSNLNPGNVWYQPLDLAKSKDVFERKTCEAYCRGDITLDEARQFIIQSWGQ